MHRVEADAVLFAVVEDRHDVGVVQLRRRPGLGLKAPHVVPVGTEPRVHDLERHLVLERLVLGFVDDAHAAAAQLAEERVVAQPSRAAAAGSSRFVAGAPVVGGPALVAGRRLEPLDELEGREELEDPRGVLGVARGVFGGGGVLAPAPALQILLGELVNRIEGRRGCVAVHILLLEKSGHALKLLLEPFQGAHVAVARGGLGQAQDLGGLAIAQLLEVAEGQHLAVEGFHGVEHLLKLPLHLGAAGGASRRGEPAQ